MFIHRPDPIHPVRVDTPDPVFAEKLLEQFGGATGELSAALTYFTQSFHTEDQGIRDMLQNIATEEFGHLEMVALMIEQHTKRAKQGAQEKAFNSTLFAMRGYGPHLVDSRGSTWDARYVNEGSSVVRDLRADIAAEAGALATYETLIHHGAGRRLARGAAPSRDARGRPCAHVHEGAGGDEQAGRSDVRRSEAGRYGGCLFQSDSGAGSREPRSVEQRARVPHP